MFTDFNFPFYRQVTEQYGVLFTDELSWCSGGYQYLHPLLFNWDTYEATVLKLDVFNTACMENIKSPDDFSVFYVPDRLCIQVEYVCFDVSTTHPVPKNGYKPMSHNDYTYEGLEVLGNIDYPSQTELQF